MFYKNLTHYAWNKGISRETARKLFKEGKIIKENFGGKFFIVDPIEIVKYFASKIK